MSEEQEEIEDKTSIRHTTGEGTSRDQKSGEIQEVSENFQLFGRRSTHSLLEARTSSSELVSFTDVKEIIHRDASGNAASASNAPQRNVLDRKNDGLPRRMTGKSDSRRLMMGGSSRQTGMRSSSSLLTGLPRHEGSERSSRSAPGRSGGVTSPLHTSPSPYNNPNTRTSGFASTLAQRQSKFRTRFQQQRMSTVKPSALTRITTPDAIRRYQKHDKVLVHNSHARFTNLVNKFGFPPGEGVSPDERRGPYAYVLAVVQNVHYEDIRVFYTVKRCDTGALQRAEVEFMEPIRTAAGEEAAMRAMEESSGHHVTEERMETSFSDGVRQVSGNNRILFCFCAACFSLALPIIWVYSFMAHFFSVFVQPTASKFWSATQTQARRFLNGMDPYVCKLKFTAINFVVICSTWFLLSDQARLAFFPPKADFGLAVVNFIIWIVLICELLFQVFIRPDEYKALVVSEKAFAPTTVRYISGTHFLVEFASLLIFIPEFMCLFSTSSCSESFPFSFHRATVLSIVGPNSLELFYGRLYHALVRLRLFGIVRHWKNMWVTNTYSAIPERTRLGGDLFHNLVPGARQKPLQRKSLGSSRTPKSIKDKELIALTNASTIGTALTTMSSFRALMIVWLVTGFFPAIASFMNIYANTDALAATALLQSTNVRLQDDTDESCAFLVVTWRAWLAAIISPDYNRNRNSAYVLQVETEPLRCTDFFAPFDSLMEGQCFASLAQIDAARNEAKTVAEIDFWNANEIIVGSICGSWENVSDLDGRFEIAQALNLREGSLLEYVKEDVANFTSSANGTTVETTYRVSGVYDESFAIERAAFSAFLLQLASFVLIIGGLALLRQDTEILVLGPLRRMLKIVAQYAKNPLVRPKRSRRARSTRYSSRVSAQQIDEQSDTSESDSDENGDEELELTLGSFETEQLITAVTKITDLLRKCWGVAGADIISTNLASRQGALTDVFNPTVPGKSVYALFGFASIDDFHFAARNLEGDIMVLINDVAKVLHGEVFRWGFGNSGQCNKNLGASFLMVYRIGLVNEVVEKLAQATDVIFSGSQGLKSNRATARRRLKSGQSTVTVGSTGSGSTAGASNISSSGSMGRGEVTQNEAMSLSLQSLPGISAFTDRAVIGMLKCFAGIHRDKKIRDWNQDFRLGAGVGTFSVDMRFGMDAGWAVEGAVGSEYKIDATYLSPHVNMAARMMSACKQYGVTILLSEAVQKLMGEVARSKLRHLDTVTVKGSSVKQKIFTYDARSSGVDFFLYNRSDEQADLDAERCGPNTWNTDQDLGAMRQHVSEDFLDAFEEGRNAYLLGDWPRAIKKLEKANELMVETSMEGGYFDDEVDRLQITHEEDKAAEEELKRLNGDGPSQYLIKFMKSHGGLAPRKWPGWHALAQK